MQHYVASRLGLRSLTMSHLWDARLKWVNLLCFVLCYGFHVVNQGGTSVPVHFVDAGAFDHVLCA